MKKNGKKKKEKKERNFTKTKNIIMIIYFLIGTLFFLSILGIFDVFNFDDITQEVVYPSEVLYDFESDVIGELPEDWRGMSWDGTEVIVWELDESFGQVAEVENRDGDGVEFATCFKRAISGIIEFDIYCDFDERVSVDITQLTDEHDPIDDIIIHLGGTGSAIKIKDGNDDFVSVKVFSVEKWYHFEIRFNEDYWELWIDGEHMLVHQGYYISYFEQPPYFCELYFSTYVDDNRFYVDNVDIDVVPI